MKTIRKNSLPFLGLIILVSLALQACNLPIQTIADKPDMESAPIVSSGQPTSNPADEIETWEEEAATPDPNQSVNPSGTGELSKAEIDGLLYMREEEKLAHDVYLALFEIWSLPIFENIAGSEQTHTDAVKNLLDLFELPDPADTSPAGVFVDEELQSLYDTLTALGAQSLGDALKVGAAIEEIDILDLQASLSETDNDAIIRVYENLLRGSENHLRAFTSTLASQTGETYLPQYLSEADYNAIIDGDTARSSQRNGRNGKGNRP